MERSLRKEKRRRRKVNIERNRARGKRERVTKGSREWVYCAVQGSGRPGQSGEGSAAQICSEADSSLTGITGLPVNNRGSDLGHLAT